MVQLRIQVVINHSSKDTEKEAINLSTETVDKAAKQSIFQLKMLKKGYHLSTEGAKNK
jgi:hypothetical protein